MKRYNKAWNRSYNFIQGLRSAAQFDYIIRNKVTKYRMSEETNCSKTSKTTVTERALVEFYFLK